MAAGGIDVIKMLPGGLSIQREQHSSTQRGSQLHPWMIKMLQDKENPKLKAKIHLIRGLIFVDNISYDYCFPGTILV